MELIVVILDPAIEDAEPLAPLTFAAPAPPAPTVIVYKTPGPKEAGVSATELPPDNSPDTEFLYPPAPAPEPA